MEAIVDQYFHASFKCKGIIALLERSIERRPVFVPYINYYSSKIFIEKVYSPVPDIVSFIQHKLQGRGSCIGYRAMQQRCIKNQLYVLRGIVAQIMKELDPVGVGARRKRTLRRRSYFSKGPN